MNLIIREGTKKDMPAVFALIQELAEFENEPEAVQISIRDLEKDGFGTAPLFSCFVAEIDGTIEGMALFYNRYSTWKGKTIHLEDLVVKKSSRNKGIGKHLYRKVIEHAKEQGCQRVEWVVLNWNTNAVNFYKKSGATVFDDWQTVQMDKEAIDAFCSN
ncbi:GNAT family N-acetyltransferase [Zunongwangia sp.]|uniref:GNAT family N-acetyltransferase n=1 Tax=Zunongwangia sp. TaxID=1965325 RepID=UPI003AA83716